MSIENRIGLPKSPAYLKVLPYSAAKRLKPEPVSPLDNIRDNGRCKGTSVKDKGETTVGGPSY